MANAQTIQCECAICRVIGTHQLLNSQCHTHIQHGCILCWFWVVQRCRWWAPNWQRSYHFYSHLIFPSDSDYYYSRVIGRSFWACPTAMWSIQPTISHIGLHTVTIPHSVDRSIVWSPYPCCYSFLSLSRWDGQHLYKDGCQTGLDGWTSISDLKKLYVTLCLLITPFQCVTLTATFSGWCYNKIKCSSKQLQLPTMTPMNMAEQPAVGPDGQLNLSGQQIGIVTVQSPFLVSYTDCRFTTFLLGHWLKLKVPLFCTNEWDCGSSSFGHCGTWWQYPLGSASTLSCRLCGKDAHYPLMPHPSGIN